MSHEKVLQVEASEVFLDGQGNRLLSHVLAKVRLLSGKSYRTYLLCMVVSLGQLGNDPKPSPRLLTMNRLWKSDRSKS